MKVRGIPIEIIQIDAAQWNHGGYGPADLVPDREVLLLRTLDTMWAKLKAAGYNPPYLQLVDEPFYRFYPVPIKMEAPGGVIIVNPVTKPAGFMGWLRYKKQIVIGGVR